MSVSSSSPLPSSSGLVEASPKRIGGRHWRTSPLPSSSGLVEAYPAGGSRRTTFNAHRCRRAAASLKRVYTPAADVEPAMPHRCRRAAASLKLGRDASADAQRAQEPHRCRRAAASLKRRPHDDRHRPQGHSPLPSSSGLVEATRRRTSAACPTSNSPLPSSSGLVEATCRPRPTISSPSPLTAAVEQRPR